MPCLAALCLIGAVAIDGDTLRPTAGPNVRIMGIDSVERGDPGYIPAREAMAALIAGQELACEPLYLDRFGRQVARCHLPDGRDLACAMVATGHARDWPKYSGGAYAECGK